MLFLMLLCLALVMSGNVVSLTVAAGFWSVLHPLLIWMGSVDPDMVGVYFGNRKYPGHIPAFTTPFRTDVGYRIPSENKSWHFWKR